MSRVFLSCRSWSAVSQSISQSISRRVVYADRNQVTP